MKKGFGAGYNDLFPKEDISQKTLSKYRILLFIKPNETLSSFSRYKIDFSTDSYNRLVSQINKEEASNVSFEVDGYAFHASKHFLIKNDYFNALLNGSFIESDQSKSIDTPISIKEVKPETFYQILQWFYTGDIPMNWRPSALFELY